MSLGARTAKAWWRSAWATDNAGKPLPDVRKPLTVVPTGMGTQKGEM